MLTLEQIESDLKDAMRSKDQTAVDVLRSLKTRIINEKIARQRELAEEDILKLVQSEIKKRKEAAAAYIQGGREELAAREQAQELVLRKYLPPQMTETEIIAIIDELIAEENFTAKDFGKVMGLLKARVGSSADGSLLARLVKERLK